MKEITQKKLKEGQNFFFSNENHQIEINDDDIRTAEVEFSGHGWSERFSIWFNGSLIHSSKTFGSMMNRLQKLVEDWNLEPISEEEFESL